jgi:ubiquinone/menaquinone biosynthesis C-methylase UbiE
MSQVRNGRRAYYNLFSAVYDRFIELHARGEGSDTRTFLVDMIQTEASVPRAILDVCCGTGAVILACAKRYPESLLIGYDFSRGMLRHARTKSDANRIIFLEGDAASLPFEDDCFDVVTCSHALYELKGHTRQMALEEMQRVVCPTGVVCLMEHEAPQRPVLKLLFTLRMLAMGSADAREFVHAGLKPFTAIFPEVSLTHSPSGKSKLVLCRKQKTDLRTSKNLANNVGVV